MSTHARITIKSAPLSDEAVVAKVTEHLSKMGLPDAATALEAAVGRYVRGKNAGKLRGWVRIHVAESGGWYKEGPGYMNGHVVLPGTVIAITVTDFMGNILFYRGRN